MNRGHIYRDYTGLYTGGLYRKGYAGAYMQSDVQGVYTGLYVGRIKRTNAGGHISGTVA
jgi:hypothetical protein